MASPPPTPLRASSPSRADAADYDDAALDRLAELLVDRLAARLGGLVPERVEPLVDAVEIARLVGRTRSWVGLKITLGLLLPPVPLTFAA